MRLLFKPMPHSTREIGHRMKILRRSLFGLLVICVIIAYKPIHDQWTITNKYAFLSCAGSAYRTLRSVDTAELGIHGTEWRLIPPDRVDALLAEREHQLDCLLFYKNGRIHDPWGRRVSVCARIRSPGTVDVVVVSPGADGRFGTGDELESSSVPVRLESLPLPPE